MQTVVNLHQGFHLNILPVIIAAILFFIVVYLISGKKAKKTNAKNFPSRSETYQFMYNQLLEKEAIVVK
jgi:uncharacterized protein YneF (UPF0154 family)